TVADRLGPPGADEPLRADQHIRRRSRGDPARDRGVDAAGYGKEATVNERSMDFSLDEQQQILEDLASSVFAKHGADDRIAQTERDGTAYDHELWAQVIETGLLDVLLPETAGGGGLGMVGLAIVLEQQGRHLCRVPLVSTAVAAMALAHFGDEGIDVLPSIRDGRVRVAVAGVDPLAKVIVEHRDEQWVLNGTLPQVYLAGSCTHLLVIADCSGQDVVL